MVCAHGQLFLVFFSGSSILSGAHTSHLFKLRMTMDTRNLMGFYFIPLEYGYGLISKLIGYMDTGMVVWYPNLQTYWYF